MINIAHYVICTECGKKFNRDIVPCKQTAARRYAHIDCAAADKITKPQEDPDKIECEQYIMNLLKEEYISPRVRKQLNQFINEYKYSYSGIRKALIYFYEVKKNDISKANGGIGIVPYCYKQAFDYYYSIWLAQQINQEKIIDNYIPQIVEVKIPPPQIRVKKKFFKFFEEDEK